MGLMLSWFVLDLISIGAGWMICRVATLLRVLMTEVARKMTLIAIDVGRLLRRESLHPPAQSSRMGAFAWLQQVLYLIWEARLCAMRQEHCPDLHVVHRW